MPSSGARSGTTPSRSQRGAGDGSIDLGTPLQCGHRTTSQPITTFAGGRKLYRCPDGCGLQDISRKKP